MPDVLVRGLTREAVARIDEAAAALGLSRNEFLRRQLEISPPTQGGARIHLDDLRRAAEAAQDLFDPAVMEQAWR